MAKQSILTGSTPNDGTGDSLLAGATKVNTNFNEIYDIIGDGSSLYVGIVTQITAGSNISVSAAYGGVTINADNQTTNIEGTQIKVSGISTFVGAIDCDGGANISGGESILSSATVSDLTNNRIVIAGTNGALEDDSGLTFNGTELVAESASVSDLTSGRVVIAGTNGSIDDNSKLTFDGNTLNVVGQTEVDDLNVSGVSTFAGIGTFSSHLYVGGNLEVKGTTSFNSGTITLGDSDSDNIVFGADIDSHIVPDDDDTYDLGSSTKKWRNLYVDGTAHLDDVNASGTITGNVTGDLSGNIIGLRTIGTGVTVTAQGIDITGICTATSFVGDGSGLTGVTASGTGVVVQEEGSSVGTAQTINFIGTGVTATFSGGTASVNITSSSSSSGINTEHVSSQTLNVVGVSTFAGAVNMTSAALTGTLTFQDNDVIELGNSGDLKLFHNGSYSILRNSNAATPLLLESSGSSVSIQKDTGESMGVFNTDGSVDLYYDNSKKFETKTSGVNVTGKIETDGIDNAGQFNIKPGGEHFKFENSSAWKLTYDKTAGFTGGGASWTYGIDVAKSYVKLYGGEAGSTKDATVVLQTKTTGVDITGVLDVSGDVDLQDKLIVTNGGVKIVDQLLDKDGHVGAAGSVLSSTGSKVDWIQRQPSIQDLQGSTSSIADNVAAELNITGYKAYSLFKITTNAAAWVRVYVDDASRDADTTRSEGEDPSPGDGVIGEVRTTGSQSVLITPGIMGFNNDNPRTNNIYLSVTNRSGSSTAITVTLTVLQTGE